MAKRTHIVLVGGGSGGHFYPLMSIAEALRDTLPDVKLSYIGPDPYDKASLEARGITYRWCPSGKRRKYASLLNILDSFKIVAGIGIALIKLYFHYPDVVVSKGGYTSVPVVLAAAFLRIPIVVHESDTRPGSANKLAAHFARHVAVSYEETIPYFKDAMVTLTGIPMRKELRAPAPANVRAFLGIQNTLPIILILGGSQGAERVNELILDTLDDLLPSYDVVHQTGKTLFETTVLGARELISNEKHLEHYRPVPFLDAETLNALLHAASIVISRAGSGSIHEIASHGKPAILIPIPEEISHDQRTNAYAFARGGGGVVIEEANLRDSLLQGEIDRIIGDARLYADMSARSREFAPQDASERLATIILELARTH
jgi:UDP-N-acetylglucosamine--N-acetylmuramyl-(pentapeptide) pyrophosphoryl-undecaprenol N-acetylglucosamine transferase